jgi:hypothetical protein
VSARAVEVSVADMAMTAPKIANLPKFFMKFLLKI